MFDPSKHVIHLVNGRLSPTSKTSGADVKRIVRSALLGNAPAGIVVHFHGGLVSEKSGRESAETRLYPLYADQAKSYPIFFVWESGFFEAPLNNLREIGREKLFREFVKKAAEWVLKKLPAGIGFKGGSGASVNEAKLRDQFDDWFAGQRETVPEMLQKKPGTTDDTIAARTKSLPLDELTLEEEITESIEGDARFQEATQEVYSGLYPQGAAPTTRGFGTVASASSLISKEAADELFSRGPGGTKGFGPISWIKMARAVARIVIRVIRRFQSGRSHGLYVTIVEETLRQLYIDKIGRVGWWDRMKGDTADAFKDGSEYGGTAFLTELRSQLPIAAPKVTLVGHSTGAIYICNFLTAASRLAPDIQFDVIFEAPAATHDALADVAAIHGSRIRNFRQFGMSDEREVVDTLVPILYTSSLLYFVSGMLENEPDEPLIGMARYVDKTDIYDAGDFPSIETCKQFYARYPNSLVWSPCTRGPGFDCDGSRHGDFDDIDPGTLGSVRHILQHGF